MLRYLARVGRSLRVRESSWSLRTWVILSAPAAAPILALPLPWRWILFPFPALVAIQWESRLGVFRTRTGVRARNAFTARRFHQSDGDISARWEPRRRLRQRRLQLAQAEVWFSVSSVSLPKSSDPEEVRRVEAELRSLGLVVEPWTDTTAAPTISNCTQ
jgi:hypothetical protein